MQSAIVVRNRLTNEIMSDEDPEPPRLPTAGSLRQLKHEYNKSQHYHDDPILALRAMTQINPYDDLIRFIALYPFYMLYWSSNQERHYEIK